MALTMLAVAAAIVLARYMQDVLIPFVLAGLGFYALDPLVDRLQRIHVPRPLGAGLAVVLVIVATTGTAYSLQDDALTLVEELPAAARRIRARWEAEQGQPPSVLERVQDAARELEETAAAASSPAPPSTPRGVDRVQIEEPTFRASDYVLSSSVGAITALGQAVLVLFLTYFLLVYDDLFKRKLVENIGPTLARKKITVQILNDIASQIEGYLLVQIFFRPVLHDDESCRRHHLVRFTAHLDHQKPLAVRRGLIATLSESVRHPGRVWCRVHDTLAHPVGAERRDDLVRAEEGARCEAHFFSPAVQLSTTVIGDATASSAAMFTRNRPSGATAYCARARNPAGAIFAPVANRVGKSATGAPASSVCVSGVWRTGTAISRVSGAT